MFERYTEKARRIIFFARYEASQFGSPYIETEYLLLGLLREDKALSARFILKSISAESIRVKIETASTKREKIATSVDLPLSNEAKRVLAYAAEEAERLSHRHIGPEHLFLGLMREKGSFAAQILSEIGLKLEAVRAEIAKAPISEMATAEVSSSLSPLRRNLTALAAEGRLNALVGREKEMQQLIQVLGRSARSSVVLVGNLGSGRRAMVEGLAQRTSEGDVPSFLETKNVVELDIDQLRGGKLGEAVQQRLLKGVPNAILFVEEFIPLLAGKLPADFPSAAEILKALLLDGKIQCICSATGEQYQRAREQHVWLDRSFTAITMPAMSQAEAIEVVATTQGRLETFHGVVFAPSAVSDAVRSAATLIKDRALPGAAIELLDEAAAHVLTRGRASTPDEIREIQKRIRFIVHRMEGAIANHEFEKARFYSDEERKEREHLRVLLEKHKIKEALQVTREDLEEVLAQWTGISVSEVRKKISSLGEEPTQS